MNRIKDLRKEMNWTQAELGTKLNVQEAAISKYESEKIPLTDQTLKKLNEIFKTSTDYILGLSNNKNNIVLSEEEINLIEQFRKLNNNNKIKIAERAEMLIELQHQEKTSTKRRDVG